jgi:cbb3-type cytochrome oxidase subunit 3
LGKKPFLLFPRVAEDEDSLVTFFLVCFLVLLVCHTAYAFAKHLDRQELERKKFYLALAEDLERLDRLLADRKEPKELQIITHNKRWAGRN